MKRVELGVSGWVQDLSAKSLSWFPTVSPVEISMKLIDCLEKKSLETKFNARVCLHKGPEAALHEMIICQRNDQAHPPKRHPVRDKTFLALRGILLVSIFNENGEVTKTWTLEPESKNKVFSVRIPSGVFHCDFALTETAVHLETTQGPFSPENDREYLWQDSSENLTKWNTTKNKLILNSVRNN
jgi:cupin fold WbuC family metalloprotein